MSFFSRRSAPPSEPASSRSTPKRTGSTTVGNVAASVRTDVAPVAHHDDGGLVLEFPQRHAVEFLAWLQDTNGRTGLVLQSELAAAYGEWAADMRWQAHTWTAIARHFRRLIGDRKRTMLIGGRRQVVYLIPPAETQRASTVPGTR